GPAGSSRLAVGTFLFAWDGAIVSLPGVSAITGDNGANPMMLGAEGAGARLALPGVTSLSGWGTPRASLGAALDLSGLTSVSAAPGVATLAPGGIHSLLTLGPTVAIQGGSGAQHAILEVDAGGMVSAGTVRLLPGSELLTRPGA